MAETSDLRNNQREIRDIGKSTSAWSNSTPTKSVGGLGEVFVLFRRNLFQPLFANSREVARALSERESVYEALCSMRCFAALTLDKALSLAQATVNSRGTFSANSPPSYTGRNLRQLT